MSKSLTYADAGVDIDKADKFVSTIKKIANDTRRLGVMSDIGGFGGLFSLALNDYERPVLVSATDGVGTKLKIAFMMDKHDTIGVDLVAMCVNDIVVQGATPLFFLDYLSMGELDTKIATDVITGIGNGCKEARCALIGGETAEMPGFYGKGEYDLAGFAVGIVDNDKIIDGSEIGVSNKIIGIASSGLHSNGYSLVRKICFDILNLDIDGYVAELGKSLGEELLIPSRIYSETIHHLTRDLAILGLVHVTGGGIVNNLLRVIPRACQVVLERASWDVPPIFHFLQDAGKISDDEMMRTFNNGIGLIAVVSENIAQDVLDRLSAMKEKAFIIGEIAEKKESAPRIRWV
ncbi:MAG: phosphoribosylformylglycinamidine cyclo-ligase [Deltaproteobacteria bacterium]|nr:phosphoribosylformylglycinamidine cyclo-ligase [Deltaproteobacteria bacterium]MBW1960212.1 phosphoribosylformylglycinamidine cyclo-ligase [Deltaproteobacteria bacterium]MBW2150615.1 phosphoribosylformylglycinamidine cyclo-ligase [Deltaproteobacteria bacterium]